MGSGFREQEPCEGLFSGWATAGIRFNNIVAPNQKGNRPADPPRRS